MKLTFFVTPADLLVIVQETRVRNGDAKVSAQKKILVKPSVTWPESVDEAPCVGWIDGRRKALDDESCAGHSFYTARRVYGVQSILRELRPSGSCRMQPNGFSALLNCDEKTNQETHSQ